MSGHDTSHIWQSLAVNLAISVAKGFAAVFTGSGAMLAETLHSFADCGNQCLLLVGVRQGQKPPDESHPLGYGRAIYFWSFLVALLLFSGGGVFSIYEGVHKLEHPEPVENVGVAVAILGFSLILEGWSTFGNIRELNRRRGSKGFFQYLRDTKDSDLVVVFGENSAAVLGLGIAMVAMLLAWETGEPHYDAIGSIGIGAVLVGVAIFLAVEVQSLLVGESADPEVRAAASRIATEMSEIERVIYLITVQQGPGEVIVAAKLGFEKGQGVETVAVAIDTFEARLREACPEVRWIFVEPDLFGRHA